MNRNTDQERREPIPVVEHEKKKSAPVTFILVDVNSRPAQPLALR
jgi:hypothetical protein